MRRGVGREEGEARNENYRGYRSDGEDGMEGRGLGMRESEHGSLNEYWSWWA